MNVEGLDPMEIERLADRAAVLRVLYEYAEALDYGITEQFVGCFTTDATFEIRIPGPMPPDYPTRGGRLVPGGVRYTGRDEILEFFRQHTHAPGYTHKHVVTNSIVDVDGDRARCRSYFQRTDASADGQNFVRVYGRYLDELRKTDGVWRIAVRVAEPDALDLREIRTASAVESAHEPAADR